MLDSWICPECGATSYEEIEECVKSIYDSKKNDIVPAITRSIGMYECVGCSRIFGDPLKFNKNKL